MRTKTDLLQCDHCEIILKHIQDDKNITFGKHTKEDHFRYSYNAHVNEVVGTYCSLECLTNDVLMKCKMQTFPIYKDRITALETLIVKLKERDDAIFQKHGVRIDGLIKQDEKLEKEQDAIKQEIKFEKDNPVPSVIESMLTPHESQ